MLLKRMFSTFTNISEKRALTFYKTGNVEKYKEIMDGIKNLDIAQKPQNP